MPPMPEVAIPRFTGKAQYASRVWFPDLLYVKFLTSPHPHARIKDIDTSAAEKMPGVKYILTYKNAPKLQRPTKGRTMPEPLPEELNLQGEAGRHRCSRRQKTSPRMPPPQSRSTTKCCRSLPC